MSSIPRPYPPLITFTAANARDGLDCQAHSPSQLRPMNYVTSRSHLQWPPLAPLPDTLWRTRTQVASPSLSRIPTSPTIYDPPASPQYSPPSPEYSTSWIPTLTLKHSSQSLEHLPASPTFSPLSPSYSPRFPKLKHSSASRQYSHSTFRFDHTGFSQAQITRSSLDHPPTKPPHPTSSYLPTPPETPEEAKLKALARVQANEAATTLLTLLHTSPPVSKNAVLSHVEQARHMLGLDVKSKASFLETGLLHKPSQLEHTPLLSYRTLSSNAKPRQHTSRQSHAIALRAAETLTKRLLRPSLRASTPLSTPLWAPLQHEQQIIRLKISPVALQRVVEGRVMKMRAGVGAGHMRAGQNMLEEMERASVRGRVRDAVMDVAHTNGKKDGASIIANELGEHMVSNERKQERMSNDQMMELKTVGDMEMEYKYKYNRE